MTTDSKSVPAWSDNKAGPIAASSSAANALISGGKLLGTGSERMAELRASLKNAQARYRQCDYAGARKLLDGLVILTNSLAAQQSRLSSSFDFDPAKALNLHAATTTLLARTQLRLHNDQEAARLFQEAIRDFRSAVTSPNRPSSTAEPDPLGEEVASQFGIALHMVGKRDQAFEKLKGASDLGSDDAEVYRYLGEELSQRSESDSAEKALRRAISLDPKDADSHVILADILLATDRREAAAELYEIAFYELAKREEYGAALQLMRRTRELFPSRSRAQIGEAQVHAAQGEFDQAIALLDQAVANDPTNALAWGVKARIFEVRERFSEALETSERSLAYNPDDPAVLTIKGNALFHQGRLEPALEALNRAIALNQMATDARMTRCRVLVGLGREQEAIDNAAATAIDAVSPEREPWLLWAELLAGARRFDDAVVAIDNALRIWQSDVKLILARGEVLRLAGRARDALAEFERAAELDDSFDTLARLATALEEAERHGQIMPVLDRLLKLDPGNASVLRGKARALRNLDRPAEALSAVDAALASDQASAATWDEKGQVLAAMMDRQDDALQAFDQAITIDPEDWNAQIHKALVLQRMNRFQEALEIVQRAHESFPNDPFILGFQGELLSDLELLDQAESPLRASLKLEPRNASVELILADVLRRTARFAEAVGILKAILAREPENIGCIRLLGAVLFGMGSFADAESSLRKAIDLGDDSPNSYAFLAQACEQNNRVDEAITEIRKGLTRWPRHPYLSESAAWIFSQCGEFQVAAKILRAAIEMTPEDAGVWFALGWALQFSGSDQNTEAMNAYKKAVQISPELFYQKGVANTLYRAGEISSAQEIYSGILDSAATGNLNPVDRWVLTAWSLFRLDKFEDAIQAYSRVLDLDPTNIASQFDLALVLFMCGRYPVALREYQHARESAAKYHFRRRRGLLLVAMTDVDVSVERQKSKIDDDALHKLRTLLQDALQESGLATDSTTRVSV